jgi:hypothetical protein
MLSLRDEVEEFADEFELLVPKIFVRPRVALAVPATTPYGKLAGLAHAKRVLTDPGQCVVNRTLETSVTLMHLNVQLRFSVGVRLIAKIPHRTSGS